MVRKTNKAVMSFDVNAGRMIHAAVNTDPLHIATAPESKISHYGLKERKVPYNKITDTKDLKMWYNFGDKIGQGGFSVVIAVSDKRTNKHWAMKTVSKSTAEEQMRLIQQEIQVLKLIRHPHIIYLDRIFECPKNIYLVLEKCADFAKVYEERKPFSEEIARKIVSELVDAIAYLHKYGNRDVKMENLLLGENPSNPHDEYYIKLADFGLSIDKFGKGFEKVLYEFCGTPQYMAPEMFDRSYTEMCDMWSVGIILYMLVIGKFPFYSTNEQELRKLICTTEPDFNDAQLSAELKELILLLLVKKAVNRIRATEVLHHPWILNKKLSKYMDPNIFQKMKEWKSELTIDDCGGASQELYKTSVKQPLELPKTDIYFDRSKKCPRKNSTKDQQHRTSTGRKSGEWNHLRKNSESPPFH